MPLLSDIAGGPGRGEVVQNFCNAIAAYYANQKVMKGLDAIGAMTTEWILLNENHYSPFWNERHHEYPGRFFDPDILMAQTCTFQKWNNRSNIQKMVYANALTHMLVLMDIEGVSQKGLAVDQDRVIFKTANEAMFMDLEHARIIEENKPAADAQDNTDISLWSLKGIYSRFVSRKTVVDRNWRTGEVTRKEIKDDPSSINNFRDVTILPAAALGLLTVKFINGGYKITNGPVLQRTVEGPVEAFLQYLDGL